MKITVPPLELSEDEGFAEGKDIFNRKRYGEHLMSLTQNTDDKLVLALDAPWGEGKTTFIKMWRGLLAQNDIKSIYFDAFENDYQKDSFLAVASELYGLIDSDSEDTKTVFKDKAVSALKAIGRGGLRVAIRAATVGILDETILEETKADATAAQEASNIIDGYIASRFDKAREDKQSIESFREYLSELNGELNGGKPIVFIVDELDRCKPPFALQTIELIKHLFSVPSLVFVLVMNKSQIEESIKCEYGNIDAAAYLHKFVDL